MSTDTDCHPHIFEELTMARFNTRVELRNLTGTDHRETYERLHDAMERAGFSTAGDGAQYHLPHAEYDKDAAATSEAILDQAKRIADSVHTPNGVIIWEYRMATWNGLQRA